MTLTTMLQFSQSYSQWGCNANNSIKQKMIIAVADITEAVTSQTKKSLYLEHHLTLQLNIYHCTVSDITHPQEKHGLGIKRTAGWGICRYTAGVVKWAPPLADVELNSACRINRKFRYH